MIDLHCHYLPGIDDGAPDLKTALALLRASVADGIQEIVITPHVYPGRWSNTLASMKKGFDELCEVAADQQIPVRLHLGGEVHLLPDSLLLADQGNAPFLGMWEGNFVMLLEFPDGQIPVGALNAVHYLQHRGITPMIAHPERNKDVMRDHLRMRPFVDAGCLLQLTAASVIGLFGSRAGDAAHRLLDRGWVTAVATDAHNLQHRPPVLTQARADLTRIFGADVAERLTRSNPARIVAGRDEPSFAAYYSGSG